ncbi:MAG: Uncharacterised protein [Cryomorphaceae bacterium]|nr:MAG: Uncharacterised protein [Cryomorphaceae bacterium]
MAIVRPFKAIRPTRDKANLVATRSYLSYSDETLKEKLEHNPFTFLHIINPDYKDKIKQKGINKFNAVKAKFNDFKEAGLFITEDAETFYIYQQKNENHTFEGIIGATAVADYLNGNIKKHEHTITAREKMFKSYLDTTGFNAEPVLLCHQKNIAINNLIQYYKATRAEYEFATTDKTIHKLWLVNSTKDINIITNSFASIDNLYIADGHHRSASSALLAQNSTKNNSPYFMSFLIDENQLNIINFNRLIKHTNGLTSYELITEIEKSYTVIKKGNIPYSPTFRDEISMYLRGAWYSLVAIPNSIKQDCVSKLDPAILSNNILDPILNITDEKTDKNISFEAGTTPLSIIKNKIDSGEYALAFILKPIPISALKEVADNNRFMPPKSTYIEPKLRSGLTIYSLD